MKNFIKYISIVVFLWMISGSVMAAKAIDVDGGLDILASPVITTSPDTAICAGASANLRVNVTSASPPYTIEWLDPSNNPIKTTVGTSDAVQVTTAGNYTVRVTNSLSEVTTSTINVTVNVKPTANYTVANLCSNDQTQFTNSSSISSGTFTSSWTFGDGNTSGAPNPVHSYAASGPYNVELIVTSNLGCTDTLINSFTINSKPEARIHFIRQCLGAATDFVDTSVISQVYTRSWNFGDPGSGALNTSTLSHPKHTYNTNGTYTVNLYVQITATGCKDTATISYVPYPKPTADYSYSTPVCAGVPVNFEDTSPFPDSLINWVYFFNDPFTTSNVSGGVPDASHVFTVAGNYNVEFRVQDNKTCYSDPLIKAITVNPVPDANAGADQTICRGDTISLTATSVSAPVSFFWVSTESFVSPSNNASVDVNPSSTTIYVANVTNTTTTCTNKDTVKVNVIDVSAVPTSGTTPLCPGASSQLHANPSGGSMGYTYLWKPAIKLSGTNIENPLASPLATTEYTVVITENQLGCIDSAKVTVALNSITVNAGPDKSFCVSALGNMSGSSNITSGISFNWTPNNTGLVDATNPTTGFNPLPVGTYTYYLEATENVYNCTVKDTVIINVQSGPVADAGDSIIPVCAGKSALLGGATVAAGGAGGPYTFEWSTGSAVFSTIAKPSVNPVVNTEYILLVRDNQSCEGKDTVTVQINPLPDVAISQDIPTNCKGSNIVVSADASNGANNIQWKMLPSTNLGTAMTQNTMADGTYRLIITNPATSCTDSSDISLDFIDPPTSAGISAVIPATSCLNVPVLMEGTSDGDSVSYRWLTSGFGYFTLVNSDSTYYVASESDTVSLNITMEVYNVCDTVSTTGTIDFIRPPVISFSADPVETFIEKPITFVNTTNVTTQTITAWQWNMQDGSTFNAKDIGTYTFDRPNIYDIMLMGTNADGCIDTFNVTIDVIKTQLIYIPNVFAPNEINPENKVCKVYGLNISKSDFSFTVFNRWGEMVYSTNDFVEANSTGWDGGEEPKGVFTYTVKGKFIDESTFEKTGTITLVR